MNIHTCRCEACEYDSSVRITNKIILSHIVIVCICFLILSCILSWVKNYDMNRYSTTITSLPTNRFELFRPSIWLRSWIDKLEPSNCLIAVTPCFTGGRLQNVFGTVSWKKAPPVHKMIKIIPITVVSNSEHHSSYTVNRYTTATILYYYSFKCNTNTHTRLTALCPGLPRWAGTRR